jgi:hypothetical protein
LEAFDQTGSYRAVAALAGCDHKTVAQYLRARDRGPRRAKRVNRRKRIDRHFAKPERWIERSRGRAREAAG